MAKTVCENACNTNIKCFYAILNYVEGKTEDCSLVKEDNDGEACGDWINNENQLNRYFYKKGIMVKINRRIRCFDDISLLPNGLE